MPRLLSIVHCPTPLLCTFSPFSSFALRHLHYDTHTLLFQPRLRFVSDLFHPELPFFFLSFFITSGFPNRTRSGPQQQCRDYRTPQHSELSAPAESKKNQSQHALLLPPINFLLFKKFSAPGPLSPLPFLLACTRDRLLQTPPQHLFPFSPSHSSFHDQMVCETLNWQKLPGIRALTRPRRSA